MTNWPKLYPWVTEADVYLCEEIGFYSNGQKDTTAEFEAGK